MGLVYKIQVTYETGCTYQSEVRTENIQDTKVFEDITWESLAVVEQNMKLIKDNREHTLELLTDDNKPIAVEARWLGYFEELMEIKAIVNLPCIVL